MTEQQRTAAAYARRLCRRKKAPRFRRLDCQIMQQQHDQERAALRPYRVIANRTIEYIVDATSEQDAIDRMIDGEGKEADGTTHKITAEQVTP